jgi:hypothetical protein
MVPRSPWLRENHGAAFEFVNDHVAGSATVCLGGFVTRSEHSFISFQKGLGADGILDLSVVLPSGKMVTANACQ